MNGQTRNTSPLNSQPAAIPAAGRQDLLLAARAHFAALADSPEPARLSLAIDGLLQQGGFGYEVLDPSGRSTADQVRQSIERMVALHALSEAANVPAPAPDRRTFLPRSLQPVVRTGAVIGRHTFVAGRRLCVFAYRLTLPQKMTWRRTRLALTLAGMVSFALIVLSIKITADNFTYYYRSDSLTFKRQELLCAVPLALVLATLAASLICYSKRRFHTSNRLSCGIVMVVVGLAIYLDAAGLNLGDFPSLNRVVPNRLTYTPIVPQTGTTTSFRFNRGR